MELYEIRAILESEAAYLATIKRTPQFIQELKETLEKLKELNLNREPEPVKLADLNGQFHSIIALASGNRYISEYTAQVRLKLKVIRTALFSSSDRRVSEIKEHEEVLRAMEEGNPALARDMMKAHAVEVIEYLKTSVLNRIY